MFPVLPQKPVDVVLQFDSLGILFQRPKLLRIAEIQFGAQEESKRPDPFLPRKNTQNGRTCRSIVIIPALRSEEIVAVIAVVVVGPVSHIARV